MPVSRRRQPKLSTRPELTPLMPRDIPASARALVRGLTRFLPNWRGFCSVEDKAVALLICAFGELARMDESDAREFFDATWRAYENLVPANRRFNNGRANTDTAAAPNTHDTN
jgi:hypothetical protein